MIKLVDTHFSFGVRPILDNVSWMLGDKDRVALVGENGSGKSTLLKILAGLANVERGKLEISRGLKAGYLPQEGLTHQGRTLEEEARTALAPILALEEQADRIEKRLGSEKLSEQEQEKLVAQMFELTDQFALRGGHELEAKIGKVLSGLGFSRREWSRPVETFSGGWQMRIALAKLLLEEPQALLLDEPTNHLDLEARNWLEGFINDYPYSCIIVSHDRYFIDVTADRIVEIERGSLIDYRGNYSYYLEEKQKRNEHQLKAYEKQQEEIKRLKGFINKYKADKKRTGQVHTRMKMLDRIDPIDPPIISKPVHFSFPAPPRGPRELIRLDGIKKSYGNNTVLDGVDLYLLRGEKVAVVGTNGAGKSTLLEILAGRNKFDQGTRKLGDGTQPAIFAQDAGSELTADETVLDSIAQNAPLDMYPRLRSMLGAFLFSGEDVDKKVGVLSGGEKSRLALARLLLRPANLLLLDEPTNHLDIKAKEVLMQAFRSYKGTLVFVAHDRYFLEGLPDRILEVAGHNVRSYIGDYSDYLRAKGREGTADVAGPGARAKPAPRKSDAKTLDKAERMRQRKQQKTKQREQQKHQRRIKELEKSIMQVEDQEKVLEQQMADPKTANDYPRLMDLENERQALGKNLEKLYQEWEDIASKI